MTICILLYCFTAITMEISVLVTSFVFLALNAGTMLLTYADIINYN